MRKNKKTFFVTDPKKSLHKYLDFTAAEQYKLLRTNLSFALHDKEKCPIVGVTSSVRGEGKSTTAVNLSYVLAENGKRVLLIDGDLRIPSVAKKMEIDSSPGLTNMLMDYENQKMSVFKSNFLDNWFILPAGDLPPNPSELLSSKRMQMVLQQLSERFDYIIIDLPPVNVVTDALVISKFISGMLLVIREDYTDKKELERCFRQLEMANVNILGCVMNATKSERSNYGKKYNSRRYGRYSRYYSKNRYYSRKNNESK